MSYCAICRSEVVDRLSNGKEVCHIMRHHTILLSCIISGMLGLMQAGCVSAADRRAEASRGRSYSVPFFYMEYRDFFVPRGTNAYDGLLAFGIDEAQSYRIENRTAMRVVDFGAREVFAAQGMRQHPWSPDSATVDRQFYDNARKAALQAFEKKLKPSYDMALMPATHANTVTLVARDNRWNYMWWQGKVDQVPREITRFRQLLLAGASVTSPQKPYPYHVRTYPLSFREEIAFVTQIDVRRDTAGSRRLPGWLVYYHLRPYDNPHFHEYYLFNRSPTVFIISDFTGTIIQRESYVQEGFVGHVR